MFGAAIVMGGGLLACNRVTRVVHTTPTVERVLILDHPGANEFVYKPRTITVRVGTRVVWFNRSLQPHTVTATGGHPSFDSGTIQLINPKHHWSFVFRRRGKYSYYCLLHPYMTGSVVVRS
jgi:plastocyanin